MNVEVLPVFIRVVREDARCCNAICRACSRLYYGSCMFEPLIPAGFHVTQV